MTNTQAALIGEALALIHGELVAIRASCERAEGRARGEALPPSRPEQYEKPSAVAEAFEAEAAELRSVAPGAAQKRDARSKRGRR